MENTNFFLVGLQGFGLEIAHPFSLAFIETEGETTTRPIHRRQERVRKTRLNWFVGRGGDEGRGLGEG